MKTYTIKHTVVVSKFFSVASAVSAVSVYNRVISNQSVENICILTRKALRN
jgi:hypothetical protein